MTHRVEGMWWFVGQGKVGPPQGLPLQKQRIMRGIHETSNPAPVGAALAAGWAAAQTMGGCPNAQTMGGCPNDGRLPKRWAVWMMRLDALFLATTHEWQQEQQEEEERCG